MIANKLSSDNRLAIYVPLPQVILLRADRVSERNGGSCCWQRLRSQPQTNVDVGSRAKADKIVERQQLDFTAHDFRYARLRDAEPLRRLGLGQAFALDPGTQRFGELRSVNA